MTSPSRTKSGKIYGPEVSATSPFYKFEQTAKGLFLGQNTAEDEDTEVFSAPMVEVSGPTGPILVYRPWSPSEIMEHAKNLPDPTEDGEKASEEWRAFCREHRPTGLELRKILAKMLTASDLAKIRPHLPPDDTGLKNPNWDDEPNRPYREAITTLCDGIKTVFPNRGSLAALRNLIQGPDERMEAFLHRCETVFTRHSGLERPAGELGNTPGPWERLLCQTIIEGMNRDMLEVVKRQYVGMRHETRLAQLQRQAKHAQDVMDENKKKAESKKEKQMSTALTLFTSQNQPQSNRDRRGRGRGRGRRERGGNQQQRGACYRCDKYGHWKDNCPQRHGPCHRCGQYGHWKDNCPQDNGPTHQKEYQQAD
ncbi:uncharacterized protein LOC121635935 [Melanotaenia boesemani]|uniref:uncharacterized protein LOC121635935 n=1 Tax=Melanotaenia boesemani TaxID=1250792 RepID=UPI001C0500D2|nr:uncharacterized protein LOC121635935 [Melanotaenia boesemani]